MPWPLEVRLLAQATRQDRPAALAEEKALQPARAPVRLTALNAQPVHRTAPP
jgi:hypothetical protein